MSLIESLAAEALKRDANHLRRIRRIHAEREGAWDAAQALIRLRWPWANIVAQHLAKPEKPERWLFSKLPEWEEAPPRNPPSMVWLDPASIGQQLDRLRGQGAELREGQRAFAEAAVIGADLPVTALVSQFYARLSRHGHGRLETSSLIKLLMDQ